MRTEETVVDQLSTIKVEKNGLRQYESTAITNTNYLNMKYRIKVSRQVSKIIQAHLEDKVKVVPSSFEFHDIIEVDIQSQHDLMSMFYAGMEMSELINNPKNWYYSETHL